MSLGLSGTVLPIHPQPKDDEIFSSWLCRIAHANGLKLHTLEVQLWGRKKQIWTRDIDRSIDEHTLASVASLSGTELARARETCLVSLEGKLFERLVTKTNSDWILPVGIFHRKRRRHGMQFCPLCLASDQSPYYRRSWRLALSTFCIEHDVLLHECCPSCSAPVMFYRQELGDRWMCQVKSFTLCTTCGFDLKHAPVSRAAVMDPAAYTALKSQRCALGQGWLPNENGALQYSHLYFSVVRHLMQKLRGNRTPARIRGYVVEMCGLPPPSSRRHNNEPLEFWGVSDRHLLLQIGTWCLLEWPTRFLALCRDLRVRYSEVMIELSPVPYWFVKEAQQLEFKPVGPSDGERAAMHRLLTECHDPSAMKRIKRAVAQRLANTSMAGVSGPAQKVDNHKYFTKMIGRR